MEYFQGLILFLLLFFLYNTTQNLKKIRRKENLFPQEPYPSVSVLIPARNEEKNIEKCMNSIIKSDYPVTEIIVLDDNSNDRTYEISRKISHRDERLKVIRGKKLPEGWTGKNWACHQLAQAARGEWLVFTDADTRHSPASISLAISSAQRNNSDFLTLIPNLVAKTWSEKLFMPLVHFAFLSLAPYQLLNFGRNSRLPIGIGPFILIDRDIYFKCGGHRAVRDEILDDMILSRRVKESRGKISVIDGTDIMSVRFYTSFKGVWKGFSKNCYKAVGGSPHLFLGVLLGCYFLFIYPYLALWGALTSHENYTLPLVQVLTISLTRIILALRFHTSLFYSLLQPFSIILALSIITNSFRLSVFKKELEWKERFYPVK